MLRAALTALIAVIATCAAAVAQIGPLPPPPVSAGVIVPPGLAVTDGYLTRPQVPFQTITETGTYRLSIYFEITSAAGGVTGDNSVSVYWTDDATTQRTVTSPAIPRGGGYWQQTLIVRATSGTTLDYSTLNFNGASAVNNWHLYVVVERLS